MKNQDAEWTDEVFGVLQNRNDIDSDIIVEEDEV